MEVPLASTDAIHVVLGSDENFAQHLAVTIASILYNTRTRVVFHIMHDGLREETIARIVACGEIGLAQFNFILLSLAEFSDLPSRANISLMTYARMKIPSLLPTLSRVLYLDCDVVVMTDLTPLWLVELGQHPVGACLDYISPHKVRVLNVDPLRYFNAGVMLMNLDAVRAMGFNDIVVKGFSDPNRIFSHDQDFLNLIFKNNWQHLHSRWNVVMHHSWLRSKRLKIYEFDEFAEALKAPGIIHYTGVKPSLYLHDSPFREHYWFYLAMTGFRDYQSPRPTWAQVGRKWRKRIKRKILELAMGGR